MRALLESNEPLVGTFVQTPSPVAAELVAGLEVDFVCVEAEHSAVGRETIQGLVAAIGAVGKPALVRVEKNSAAEIGSALDAGAAGVIVPRVDSAADASAAGRAARYPPRGTRGIGPSRAAGYGRSIADYLERANEEIVVGVQIESETAVRNVAEIVRAEEVDFVFVGPADLALSLGVPFGDARAGEAIESVLAEARHAGRAAGIWAGTSEQAAHWLRLGVRLVILGSDLGWLATGLESALVELRNAQHGGPAR